jgi:hypothetical protein
MKHLFRHAYFAVAVAAWLCAGQTFGQITINEIVEDEQDFDSTNDLADTREFVELYNAGASSVNIENWTIGTVQLGTGLPYASFTLPAGASIPAHGYYVIGQAGVPNVNFTPESGGAELYPNRNTIFELRNPTATLVDAVGLETFVGNELAAATQEQLDQMNVGQTAGPAARGGWWGQQESNNADLSVPSLPNLPLSIGRYKDGYDHNVNGRDFGILPATPGATNNLSTVSAHDVTNVDALPNGNVLRDDYYASFKLPRVITPGTVDTYNPNAIPASPQGGKAIIAWDETGGGNAVFSDEYSNKFKIYAYIDPTPFNNTTADSTRSEASIYGIGTTDTFFGTPNSADLLTGQPGTGGNITSSANGSTGVGWLIQRRTSNTAGTQSSAAVLQLIDFNDGGDGVLADADWIIKHQVNLTGLSAGWHVLGVDYNPVTGAVVATYDGLTINFDTTADLVGNFYIGYREQLPGTGTPVARPPTYDLFVGGLPGDFNNNGKVDAGDYVTWRKNAANASLPNDNGLTTQAARFSLWRSSFGTPGSGSGSLGAGTVPEPGTIGLALIGMFSLSAGRRRRIG